MPYFQNQLEITILNNLKKYYVYFNISSHRDVIKLFMFIS